MATSITPFLMFQPPASAETAVAFYVSLFPNSAIDRLEKYGDGEHGAKGTVKRVDFHLAGQAVIAIDSPVQHAFAFTPSMSLFVECASETELHDAFTKLSADGAVLMPEGNYGFSRLFGWVNDRYGVSWQLNLP